MKKVLFSLAIISLFFITTIVSVNAGHLVSDSAKQSLKESMSTDKSYFYFIADFEGRFEHDHNLEPPKRPRLTFLRDDLNYFEGQIVDRTDRNPLVEVGENEYYKYAIIRPYGINLFNYIDINYWPLCYVLGTTYLARVDLYIE